MSHHLNIGSTAFVEHAKRQVWALYPRAKADVFETTFNEVVRHARKKASLLKSPTEQAICFEQEIKEAVAAALKSSNVKTLRTIH